MKTVTKAETPPWILHLKGRCMYHVDLLVWESYRATWFEANGKVQVTIMSC